MKDKKVVIKFFSIVQYVEEGEYLGRMHAKGWKFERVSGLCVYHFVKCEPEDVVYQLDYNQRGLAFKDEYVKMFEDCGWEYIQDYFGFSYFRKPAKDMDGPEEIFCDDESKLDMAKRVFKGRVSPMIIIFTMCLMPQLINLILRHNEGEYNAVILSIYCVLTLVYIGLFISFGRFYYHYNRKCKGK